VFAGGESRKALGKPPRQTFIIQLEEARAEQERQSDLGQRVRNSLGLPLLSACRSNQRQKCRSRLSDSSKHLVEGRHMTRLNQLSSLLSKYAWCDLLVYWNYLELQTNRYYNRAREKATVLTFEADTACRGKTHLRRHHASCWTIVVSRYFSPDPPGSPAWRVFCLCSSILSAVSGVARGIVA
jgi:hypothetical protein